MATSSQLTSATRLRKSTGVRISGPQVAILRAYFGVLSRVAPRTAEQHAALLFCFPRRLPHHDVPHVPAHALGQGVVVGKKRIAAWTWGEGPRVLLAHGWEGTGRDMVPIALALAEQGRSVTVFDMPAHGASTGRTTTLPEMADALAAVARTTGTPDAVVGHSLGGAAAVLALRDGLGASTAALIAPAADPRLWVRRLADLLAFSDEQYHGLVNQIERRAGIGIDEIDSATVAHALTARALILHDPTDRQVPFAHGEALARAWRGATLLPLQGLGHRRVLHDAMAIERVVAHIIG